MVPSTQLKQDPANLNLCIARARHDPAFGINISNEELIPFAIDMRFVNRERQEYPDVTFFATNRGLIECTVTGLGKYGPMIRDSAVTWYWKSLLPMPPRFKPSIDTSAGKQMAAQKCLKALHTHADLPNFDHAGYNEPYSVGYIGSDAGRNSSYPAIAGVSVSSYDVLVTGAAYFRTGTVDQVMLLYTCLYSPMLELRAVGWRKNLPGHQVWLQSAQAASLQKEQSDSRSHR